MSNKTIFLATIAVIAVSSILLVGSIGTQPAEAGSDANCPAKSGAATAIDPNTPNAMNTGSQPLSSQPTF
jgi:hypothetical protein